ncbi:MAG TPA: SPASM domain-containing protein, partial [Terriglobales bacterium]|nr:SPASM domain-containing protein [Terriglobales bacterium]
DEQAEAFLAHWQPLLGHRDQVVVTRGFNWGIAGGVTSLAATERLEHNRVPCISLWTSFVIDVDGQVRMCCADPQGSSLLGDVRESTIAEIWHGAELDRLRRLHLDGRRHELPLCDGCPVWSTAKHALKQPGAAP